MTTKHSLLLEYLQNQTTGEIMRATADANLANNTVEETSVVHHTKLQMMQYWLLLTCRPRRWTSPTAISFDPTTDFNFTQIFKTAVQAAELPEHILENWRQRARATYKGTCYTCTLKGLCSLVKARGKWSNS